MPCMPISGQTSGQRIVPQMSPTAPIVDAAVSQEAGALLAATEKKLFVWNLQQPHAYSLVRTADGHKKSIIRVEWNPSDPSQFASLDEESLILWNTVRDSIVITAESDRQFTNLAFGVDNDILAVAVKDRQLKRRAHQVRFFLPQTGHRTSDPIQMPSAIASIMFWSSSELLCGMESGMILKVAMHDGKRDTLRAAGIPESAVPHRMLRSPNGALIAVYGGRDSTYVVQWRSLADIGVAMVLPGRQDMGSTYAGLSFDGKVLLPVYSSEQGSVSTYAVDVAGRKMQRLQFKSRGAARTEAVYNEVVCEIGRGRLVAVRGQYASQQFSLSEYDPSGEAVLTRYGSSSPVQSVSVGITGSETTIAIAGSLGEVTLLSSGYRGVRTLRQASQSRANNVLLIDDQLRQIIVDSIDVLQVFPLRSAVENQPPIEIPIPTDSLGNILACLLTSSRGELLVVQERGVIRIDRENPSSRPDVIMSGWWKQALPLSPTKAILIDSINRLSLFDARYPLGVIRLPDLSKDYDGPVDAAALESGNLAISFTNGHILWLRVDTTTNGVTLAGDMQVPTDIDDAVMSLCFGRGGRLFAATASGSVYSWSGPTALGRLFMHVAGAMKVRYVPGRLDVLVVGSSIGLIAMKRIDDGHEVTLLQQGQGWIAYSPEGLFEYEGGGNELIRFVDGYQPIDVKAAEYQRYERSILQRFLAGAISPEAASNIIRVPPRATIVPLPVTTVDVDQVLISVVIRVAKEQEVRKVRVQINGKLVLTDADSRATGESREYVRTYSLPLVPGLNQITALVEDAGGMVGRDTVTIQCAKKVAKRTLYIVGVGVNDYVDPTMRLRFAVSDVGSIVTRVESNVRDKRLFDDVRTTVLADRNVTVGSVEKMLENHASNVKPYDGLLVVFAGHGVSYKNATKDQSFAFLTSEADTRSGAGRLTIERIAGLLSRIPANQQSLIIDACYAGGAIESAADMYATARSYYRTNAEAGIVILTSVQADKRALEVPSLEHGLFSAAFLNGIENGYDFKGNVDVLTAGRFAVEDIQRLSAEHVTTVQVPQLFFSGQQTLIINRIEK